METLPERKSLKEDTLETLHDMIISGQYRPGDWLRQEDIAEQLKVSMTPVREALDLLVSIGLAERVPYRGVRVPQPTAEEMAEAFALRLLLEQAGTRAAAIKREQAQIDELKRIVTQTKNLLTLKDMSTQRKLSRQFHKLVIEAGGNTTATRLYEMVMNMFPDWMLYKAMFRNPDRLVSRLEHEFEEHEKMLDAIIQGDANLAEQRAREHMADLGMQLVTILGVPQALLDEKVELLGLMKISS